MGLFSFVFSILGFGVGLLAGLIIGYFGFIYKLPTDVKKADVKAVVDVDEKVLKRMLPEIPLWVKMPDYDRVDWLNKFLKELWPFLDKAVCKTVKEIAIPIIEEKKPPQIQSITFAELTLGDLPPMLSGVKVYDTVDKEMIIEPFIKWAGNPNIVIAVKGYGVTATVQLTEVTVCMQVRATFKPLVDVFPCFSKIYVSLMQKPEIDFSLKLLGGDAMAIPGLAAYVQEVIKDIVADMLLWPKSMQVFDLNIEDKKNLGLLYVKVLSAKGLKNLENIGKSDPLVAVSLGPPHSGEKKTNPKMGTLNPVWNQDLLPFTVMDAETTIKFEVRDFERVMRDRPMGVATCPLKSLTPGEKTQLSLELKKNLNPDDPANQKSRGVLIVEVRYQPFLSEQSEAGDTGAAGDSGGSDAGNNTPARIAGGSNSLSRGITGGSGILVIEVHAAEDLDAKNNCNAMCKITVRGATADKTKTVKRNNNPIWDHHYEHYFTDAPRPDEMLKIEVFSKSKGQLLGSKEALGWISIPLHDVVTNRRLNEWYQLQEARGAGRINVELRWEPTGASQGARWGFAALDYHSGQRGKMGICSTGLRGKVGICGSAVRGKVGELSVRFPKDRLAGMEGCKEVGGGERGMHSEEREERSSKGGCWKEYEEG
ncbi:hypothetical protein CBR_g22435 [Chara braunii]|uniref:Uncharacterized protein n=1 Tax=Chara braunii TaxID=69332 RepID=A0A388JV42_CHABU|nr:hypothetical protein CBR_g22435 [Chara braunii]|eukprot:GBG61637.1 hypothetical protein CBR_g22435 [Chara braunii]